MNLVLKSKVATGILAATCAVSFSLFTSCTTAEPNTLTEQEKNTISHRGKAVEAMMDFLSAPLQPNCRP